MDREQKIKFLEGIRAGKINLAEMKGDVEKFYTRVSAPVKELVEDTQGDMLPYPVIADDVVFRCQQDGKTYTFKEIEQRAPKSGVPIWCSMGEHDEITTITVSGATKDMLLEEAVRSLKK